MLCSSSAKSASELLRARNTLKILTWLPLLVLRGCEESVASSGWAGRGDRGGCEETHRGCQRQQTWVKTVTQGHEESDILSAHPVGQICPLQLPPSSPPTRFDAIFFSCCCFVECCLPSDRTATALGTAQSLSPGLGVLLPTGDRRQRMKTKWQDGTHCIIHIQVVCDSLTLCSLRRCSMASWNSLSFCQASAIVAWFCSS